MKKTILLLLIGYTSFTFITGCSKAVKTPATAAKYSTTAVKTASTTSEPTSTNTGCHGGSSSH